MSTSLQVLDRTNRSSWPVTRSHTPLPTLVVIPTYNEAGNIATVLRRVRAELPDADVLVVDDNSPDGTADIVDELGAKLGHLLVLHRPVKGGLGSAYRAGFAFGLTHGYGVVVEMDADLSHDPAALPKLVGAVEGGADLAIGSRYVDGASIPDWSSRRRALSRYGNRYAGTVLGVPIHDLTSGYRAYRAESLRGSTRTRPARRATRSRSSWHTASPRATGLWSRCPSSSATASSVTRRCRAASRSRRSRS